MSETRDLLQEALGASVAEGDDFVPRLTLRQLSYFVAAAHQQSVVKAAQALNVSPPSVSAAIAQLESVVGVQLFVRRHARGLVLTQAGRDLAVDARNLLLHARELQSARLLGARRIEGRLDLGCLVSFAPFLVPPLLRGFQEHYPKIRIRWQEGDHEKLIAGLEDGALDLALLYEFDIPSTVQCMPLREMPPQIVLPAGHALASRRVVPLAAAIGEPFVLLDLPRTRDYFLSVFAELGLEPRIAHRAQSFEMVRSLVANGFGYSLLNFCPPYRYPGHGAIVSRPLAETPRIPNLVCARLYRLKTPRTVEAFIRHAVGFAARLPVATAVIRKSRTR